MATNNNTDALVGDAIHEEQYWVPATRAQIMALYGFACRINERQVADGYQPHDVNQLNELLVECAKVCPQLEAIWSNSEKQYEAGELR